MTKYQELADAIITGDNVKSKEIKIKYEEVEKNKIKFYLPKNFDLNLEGDKKRYIFITNLYKKYREIILFK